MDALAYKSNADVVFERLRTLYERRAQDQVFATFGVPSAALAKFAEEHQEAYCDYPDPSSRLRFWDSYLRERSHVDDDSIPSACLKEFDQGLYGGLVGGDVQFMCRPDRGQICSMVAPVLNDWSEVGTLHFNKSHPWFQRYIRQLEVFVEGAAGKFGISHLILIDSLNFAFELVGATNTYRGLLDCPELVRQAIEFAFDLNVEVQKTFFDYVPAVEGGTCSSVVQWIPGQIVSESVDPFHMTSVDYFELWGRGPIERILAQFDGGVLHIHGNGRHLLEAVSSLKRLKAIYLGDDRGFPLAFDVQEEVRARTGDMPLVIKAPFGKFSERLSEHKLVGGVLYEVEGASDVDAVNRCMDGVRTYRV